MDYTPLIEKRRQRLEELETVIAEPDFFNDQKKASEIMREHRRLKELMETWDSLNATEQQLADNQELATTDDPELAELAALEIPELEAALEKLRSDVQYSLLPATRRKTGTPSLKSAPERAGMKPPCLPETCCGCTSVLRKNAAGASSIWKAARRTWADSRKSSAALPGKKCSAS